MPTSVCWKGSKSYSGRPVDLVVESTIDNPYFRESVEESRTPLYSSISQPVAVARA